MRVYAYIYIYNYMDMYVYIYTSIYIWIHDTPPSVAPPLVLVIRAENIHMYGVRVRQAVTCPDSRSPLS